jgi:hypothetical protein
MPISGILVDARAHCCSFAGLCRVLGGKLVFYLIFGTLLSILTARASSADEYSIVYAIEIGDRIETGRVDHCSWINRCEIRSSMFHMSISIDFVSPAGQDVGVWILGEPGCCYFSDGNSSLDWSASKPVRGMGFFWGHARLRNEYVQNLKVGSFDLRFVDHR